MHAVIQLPPDLFFGTTIGDLHHCAEEGALRSQRALRGRLRSVRARREQEQTGGGQSGADSLPCVAASGGGPRRHAGVDCDIAANELEAVGVLLVEPEDTREQVDIVELNTRIAGIVERQQALRASIDAIIAELEADQ